MTAVAISQPSVRVVQASARMPRLRKGGALFLALGLVAAVGASSFYTPPARGLVRMPVSDEMRMQISTMSTGTHQTLVLGEETAEARNARIPLVSGGLVDVAGFAEISPTSAQYPTALRCLTQAIYYEAANESELGKRAVAQVVLNRVRHPAYPNSVCGVVYEGANAPVCQFSFTCDGSLLRPPMARQWQESRRVAAAALAGQVTPEVGSATNYHADYVLPAWAFTLHKLQKIGAHIFYRFPGRAGSAGVLSDRWNGSERIPALDFARLRHNLDADAVPAVEADEQFVQGLTVVPDVKDRHAANDVGGRLDTTTQWRMTIPDPTQLSDSYRIAMSSQGDAPTVAASAPPSAAEN